MVVYRAFMASVHYGPYMSTVTFPQSLRQRFRWIVHESLLIAGIFLFWIGIGLALLLVLGIIAVLIREFHLVPLEFVYEFASRSEYLWAAVTQLALATTGLYILVRTGTILVDRYQSRAED